MEIARCLKTAFIAKIYLFLCNNYSPFSLAIGLVVYAYANQVGQIIDTLYKPKNEQLLFIFFTNLLKSYMNIEFKTVQ